MGGPPPPEVAETVLELERRFMQEPEKPSKRHHYVSEFYLKKWTKKGDRRVLSLDRRSGVIKPIGIKDAAVSSGFYNAQLEDGTVSTAAERVLSYVEDASAPLLELLAPGEDLSMEDKGTLALYLAFQALRGRGNRSYLDQSLNLVEKSRIIGDLKPGDREGARRRLEELGHEPNEEGIDHILEWVEDPDLIELKNPTSNHVRAMMQIVLDLAPYIWTREWNVLETTGERRFVTTDEPLVLVRPLDPYSLGGFALAPEVLYPLSPTRLLVLSLEKLRAEEMNDESVRLHNDHLAHFVHDRVFATLDDQEELERIAVFLEGRKRPEARIEQFGGPDGSRLFRLTHR